jgi:hypothetical protein
VKAFSRRTWPCAVLGCLMTLLLSSASHSASNPSRAEYSSETDRLFWFLHITDIHVGWPLTPLPNLRLLTGEGTAIIRPAFTVLTGDLVDTGGVEGFWQDYRAVINETGQTANSFFEIPGNHDSMLDGDLSHYLTYSIQGEATGQFHGSWIFHFPFGSYQILGLNASSGEIDQNERNYAQAALESADVRLALVCGHYPLHAWNGADPNGDFQRLLADHHILTYFYGHTHGTHEGCRQWYDGVLHWLTGTLGKPVLENFGTAEFTVFAIDHDALSLRLIKVVDDGLSHQNSSIPWPMVLITAPVDAELGGENPWAYAVSAEALDNPIRTLVFAPGEVQTVTAQVDDQTPFPLERGEDPRWIGMLVGTGLTVGQTHTLTVVARSQEGEDSQSIRFKVNSQNACGDGIDNEGDGLTDFPEDPGCTGLFDTDESNPCACEEDADCDDELACNGQEICQHCLCVVGELPSCDDGNDCTQDECREPEGCVHTPVTLCPTNHPSVPESCSCGAGSAMEPTLLLAALGLLVGFRRICR